MPLRFEQAFPLGKSRLPAVKWGDPANCRPSDDFPEGVTYGVPTGERNGVWVLDLDRNHQEGVDGLASLSAYAGEREVPDTFTVRTGRGGLHLYFRWDPARPVRNRRGMLPGVDARGRGGFVRLGGPWAVALDAPLADAPDWLYDLVTAGVDADAPEGCPAYAISPDHPDWLARVGLAVAYVAAEPPCIEGEGKSEDQCWKMALRLTRTYELPATFLLEEVLPVYFARCAPPGYVREKMRRALARAAEIGQGLTGTFSPTSHLLSPPASPAAICLPENGEWRQMRNPAHVYSCDLAAACAGGMVKQTRCGPKETAATFTGPGALPDWRGVWQFDAFRRRVIAINPPFPLDAERTGMSNDDLARVQVWLSCVGAAASVETIRNGIAVASRAAEFHPVRDYLDGLAPMSVEDARAYFAGCAGRWWGATERDALESDHLKRFAVAAVRRIRRPGTKVDTMLVLAGEQGFRKSALCAHLAGGGEWFLDQMPSLEKDREASIAIEGYWLIEFAEFRGLDGSREATKKEFITRCVDKYRPVWASQVQVFPRPCVFIGTTNDDDFLTDPTGDTRYDIVVIEEPIRLDDIDRDRFWAAACALEAAGETHYRDRAARARESAGAAAQENAAFHSEHPWTSRVLRYCAGDTSGVVIGSGRDARRWITAVEVLEKCLALPAEKQTRTVQNDVRAILRRAFGASKVQNVDGRSQRAYALPASAKSAEGASPGKESAPF